MKNKYSFINLCRLDSFIHEYLFKSLLDLNVQVATFRDLLGKMLVTRDLLLIKPYLLFKKLENTIKIQNLELSLKIDDSLSDFLLEFMQQRQGRQYHSHYIRFTGYRSTKEYYVYNLFKK